MSTPSADYLEPGLIQEGSASAPLHAQVRRVLRDLIDAHFDDGQQFWTEGVLTERLGVSRITVRRALEDLTREGVLQRYRAKGSFVNKATGPLPENGRHHLSHVGVFVPRADSPLLAVLLEQVGLIGAQRKQRLVIHLLERGASAAETVDQLDHSPREMGVLLMGAPYDVTQGLFEELKERGYRVVCVDTPAKDAPYVGVDNEKGIALGLGYLRELGHRNVAFIANEPLEHPNVADRAHFFRRFCKELEMDGHVLDPGHKAWENTYTATYYVIQAALDLRVTALFTASDSGAWSALRWLRQHDYAVPQAISVLGFDDETPSQHTFPALSSIAIPLDQLARKALELLASPDLGSTFWPPRHLVEPCLVIRESTAPPPEEAAPDPSTAPSQASCPAVFAAPGVGASHAKPTRTEAGPPKTGGRTA